MAHLVQAERPSTAALSVMREWRPADFRANHARMLVEANSEYAVRGDKDDARCYLAQARMVRECAAIFAPSRLP